MKKSKMSVCIGIFCTFHGAYGMEKETSLLSQTETQDSHDAGAVVDSRQQHMAEAFRPELAQQQMQTLYQLLMAQQMQQMASVGQWPFHGMSGSLQPIHNINVTASPIVLTGQESKTAQKQDSEQLQDQKAAQEQTTKQIQDLMSTLKSSLDQQLEQLQRIMNEHTQKQTSEQGQTAEQLQDLLSKQNQVTDQQQKAAQDLVTEQRVLSKLQQEVGQEQSMLNKQQQDIAQAQSLVSKQQQEVEQLLKNTLRQLNDQLQKAKQVNDQEQVHTESELSTMGTFIQRFLSSHKWKLFFGCCMIGYVWLYKWYVRNKKAMQKPAYFTNITGMRVCKKWLVYIRNVLQKEKERQAALAAKNGAVARPTVTATPKHDNNQGKEVVAQSIATTYGVRAL